jgi:heme/copper-type cytochrome/quinol oxidase subunit 4
LVLVYSPDVYQGLFFNMKTLFTILFFADTLLLIGLSYFFLKMMDNGGHGWTLIAILSAIVGSIILLVFFFRRYIKLPPDKPDHF